MKHRDWQLMLACTLCSAFVAQAQQTSNGAQSPVINHMPGGVINYHIESPRSAKLSSLDAKREALLLAENPTVLEIRELKWASWFGDNVPFLGVQIVNLSKLPASNVRLQILDKHTGGTIASLKPYRLSKSYTLKLLEGRDIAIAGGGAWTWPIASVTDMQKITERDCLIDAGLEFDASNLTASTDWKNFKSGRASTQQTGFYFRLSYKTIFGEKVTYEKMGIVDSASRSLENAIQRGTGQLIPLKCVGDPEV
jgi:hypothetical protein